VKSTRKAVPASRLADGLGISLSGRAAPAGRNPLSSFLVRVKRPDGKEILLRVPEEHLQRVMDLASGEFGDKSIKG
jgi:hypothetical protein